MNDFDPAAEFRIVLRDIDVAVRAGEMPRAARRSLIRMGQMWFRRPARISRMHSAYGRKSR